VEEVAYTQQQEADPVDCEVRQAVLSIAEASPGRLTLVHLQ
jgi:hypothetical protein